MTNPTTPSSGAPKEVVGLLRDRNLTIGFAESCTGGRLAADLTTVPGSSEVVRGSFVTYQLEGKRRMLKLDEVNDRNVVSDETARKMAEATQRVLETDVVVAVTGYLNPDTEGGPHAFVAFRWPESDKGVKFTLAGVTRLTFPEGTTRAENRDKVVGFVFDELKRILG
jgi:PncC family amidohydrolase